MRHTVSFALTAALLLLPVSGLAAVSFAAPDMIAGLGGDIKVAGIAADVTGTVRVTNPAGTVSTLPFTADKQGNAMVNVNGNTVQIAGAYTIALSSTNAGDNTTTHFTVLPDVLDAQHSTITADRTHLTPDGKDAISITVSLKDKYGNPLDRRPVEVISSRSSDDILPLSSETDAQGNIRFTFTTKEIGSVTLRAFDLLSARTLTPTLTVSADSIYGVGGPTNPALAQNPYGQSPYPAYPSYYPPYPYMPPYYSPYNYAPSNLGASLFGNFAAQTGAPTAVDHFDLQIAPKQLNTNDAATLTITALRADGSIEQGYQGTVAVFSPTDPTMTLPGSGLGDNGNGQVTFVPQDLGSHRAALAVVPHKSGTQRIVVEDRTNPAKVITGQIDFQVSGTDVIDPANLIDISYPPADGAINTLILSVKGKTRAYTNVKITAIGAEGDGIATGDSDGNGDFAIPLRLKADQPSYLLRAQSIDGNLSSRDIKFIVITKPPNIASVQFLPEKPQPKENVLLTVTADPKLKNVKMKLGDQEYALAENSSQPGSYQVAFSAPETSGKQPVKISGEDIAGNISTTTSFVDVAAPGLPIVTGLTATAEANAVELNWDASPEPGVTYRVYFGENPQDVIAADTKQSVTKVKITDLKAATTYYFAVTAVKGDSESIQKSEYASATPLGLLLNVQSAKDALELDWKFPNDIQLSAFILQYGTEPDNLTERRLIGPSARQYIMGNLINGVKYYVTLTPIALTGQALSDLVAKGEGEVGAFTGYRPKEGEQVTARPGDSVAPPNNLHTGAPSTPTSGIPAWAMIAIAGAAAVVTLLAVRSRSRTKQTQAFLTAMNQRYRS